MTQSGQTRRALSKRLLLSFLIVTLLLPGLTLQTGATQEPVATPESATPVAGTNCVAPCLVRLPATENTTAALARTGMRPSYATDEVIWTGGTPEDIAKLAAAGAAPEVVASELPSLNLYVVHIPEGLENLMALDAFGTVVDRVGPVAVVEVPAAPAVVTDLLDWGFTVEKFAPYVPAGTPRLTPETIANLPPVTNVLDEFPDLSVAEIERSILDLQAMGAAEPGGLGSRYNTLPGNAQAAEYLYLRLASYGLDVWYEDYVSGAGTLGLNVVGEIPGTDPSQVYALFAHYDTIADDVESNAVAPGALDNGTGLSILLENARLLANYRLTYPLRIVALDGEEVGLEGSTAFGRRAMQQGTPFVGGINVDSVGTAYGERRLIVNAAPSAIFVQDILAQNYDAYGFSLNILVRQNPAIVSDEVPLTDYGIPTILVASMVYGDPLINCSCDTIDGVDLDYVRASGRLVLLTLAVLTSPLEHGTTPVVEATEPEG